MAEKSALIGKVTDVVLAKAIAQAGEWAERGGDIKVSINLSARSIHDINFPDQVRQLCAQHGIEPDQITFEITETAAMHDAVMMMDVLARLRLEGFRLSIDDFGTGYSSLAQLQRLPFSELKIDLLFISTMATSRESEIIVKTIIDMAHNLGLRTVAEGVENSATLNRLRELGCNLAQGYFIGRPMPARQMAPFLAAHQVFHYPGAARDLVTQRSL
jgi:EAL domain-containing protein (putative c-di-GMP-specific phosphodiesterase class I)